MKKFGDFSDGPSGLLGAPGMAPDNDPRFLQNVPVANGFLTFLITPSRRPEPTRGRAEKIPKCPRTCPLDF